jgi:hypothetical protein
MSTDNPLLPSDQSEFDRAMNDLPDGEVPPEEQIIATPKRKMISQTSLLMLGLLAAVGGVTYLMILRAGVQITGPGDVAAAADTTINTFLGGGVQSFRQKIAMLADTEKTVAQFNDSPASHQVAASDLHGNPFGVAPVKEEASGPLSDEAARRHAEELRKDAAVLAANLKLQSVLYGPHSGCMIDGKLYVAGKGDGMFTVITVNPQSVIVRINGQDFELRMIPPQTKD